MAMPPDSATHRRAPRLEHMSHATVLAKNIGAHSEQGGHVGQRETRVSQVLFDGLPLRMNANTARRSLESHEIRPF